MKIVLALCAFVFVTSCTDKKTSTTYQVTSLSTEQKLAIRSLAQAGIFLGPGDEIPSQLPSKEERCAERIAALPKDYIHGWLEVPENPADVEGRKISVFYYGRVVADPNLKQDVTIFYNGGPGSDSESSFNGLYNLQMQDPAKNKVSFLYIDQRGNGCSDPFPQGMDPETLQRLTHYGTRGIVSDSEKIREHLLGTQQWRIFGQSYGAYIVHKYAIVAPESVYKAYAHANALTSSAAFRHAERILSQDRVFRLYMKMYPQDEAKVLALNKLLQSKPCFVFSDGKTYCGYALTTPFISMLGFNRPDKLHIWISEIVSDSLSVDINRLQEIAAMYIDPPITGNDQEVAQYVIACTDRNYCESEGKQGNLCDKSNDLLRSRGLNPDEFLVGECKDETATYADGTRGQQDMFDYTVLKDLKQDFMTSEQLKTSLVAHPSLEFHLYSGELDTFVPKANFTEELAVVGEFVKYTHFLKTGHDGFRSESQVWADLIK